MTLKRGDRVFTRGRRLWCRYKDRHGKWVNKSTPYDVGEEHLAIEFAALVQAHADRLAGRGTITALVNPSLYDCVVRAPRAIERSPSNADGIVYVVQLWPVMVPGRLKLGHTTKPLQSRLHVYRTSCPEAVVLAFWSGSRDHEQRLLRTLPGRMTTTEVFDVESPDDFLFRIDAVLGHRAGGLTVVGESR